MAKHASTWKTDLGRILGIWVMALAVAAVWVVADRRPPGWDQAEHLSFAMNYWWTLTHSHWLTPEGWRHLWMLSSKYPPVMYLAAAGVHTVFGPGPDIAVITNGVFALVLLIATYGLGRHLFSPQVGLLAAGLTLIMPRLLHIGLDFQLDYAVTAMVMVSFWCLTVWRDAPKGWRAWGWILGFGLSYGLALMTKQSALLFLFVPLAWVSLSALWQRRWLRILQLLAGGMVTLAVMAPWLSVNWLFQLSIVGNTNVASAQAEGDPLLNTLAAWTYYWQDLPGAVSWPILVVPLVGLLLWWLGLLPGRRSPSLPDGTVSGRLWLLAYIVGAYLLWSAIVNKDDRYIAPLLPALAVLLAWGLACWWRKWPWVTIATLLLGTLTALLSIFPTRFADLADALAPDSSFYAYRGEPYPHRELVDHVAQTQPYQLSNIGGLQSTAQFNQHNVSYYGKLVDYQVYARQIGSRVSQHDKDLESLSWFYAQGEADEPWPPEDNEENKDDEQAQLARKLDASPEFTVDRTWDLPNGTRLYLYRRQQLPVTVTALEPGTCPAIPQLRRVDVPEVVPPGQPMPVIYEWVGQWQALRTGLGLLTWEAANASANPTVNPWIHDHGIGLGTLRPHPIYEQQTTLSPADIDPAGCFQVTERTATLPPENLPDGTYRLTGTYINTTDGSSQPLQLPNTLIQVEAQSPSVPAPHLDWVTQLREVSGLLSQGPDSLGGVFDPIGRINLYDPIHNYLVQAEQSLGLRWQDQPERVEYGYGLVLSQVLQLKVNSALDSLQDLVQQDANNPYAHAYRAFVNLYAFQPRAAEQALAPALEMAPDSPEIQGLNAAAALLQGNVWGAWQRGKTTLALLQEPND